jgi:argininosuccinate lyase
MQAFGASLPVDWRLWRQDIAGSKAHANMLAQQGVLTAADAEAICAGLELIAGRIEAGEFGFDVADEDIHMAIERALTAEIGEAGGRLHTGRSRNDQVACDTRLYAHERAADLMFKLFDCRLAILDVAIEALKDDVILPGYTHLQKAQPVLLTHHLLAWYWMLARDTIRMLAAHNAANASPLGAAALAGTSYPLDRQFTASALGFSEVIPNSLDAVSDRDYLLDLVYACATTMLHLSRICEELVLWSSDEFGFITLSDSFATGSSIMPQKKNPDFAELVRGKSGRVIGDLTALMVTLKGLPLAYNKDLQEDKEGAFDAIDTLALSLEAVQGMIATMQINADRMLAAAQGGYMAATDLADYLVGKGVAFREAHAIVGKLVGELEAQGRTLQQLTLEELQAASPAFAADALDAVDIANVVARRNTFGGTAHEQVARQLKQAMDTQNEHQEQLRLAYPQLAEYQARLRVIK